jgi:hypothetical protein
MARMAGKARITTIAGRHSRMAVFLSYSAYRRTSGPPEQFGGDY